MSHFVGCFRVLFIVVTVVLAGCGGGGGGGSDTPPQSQAAVGPISGEEFASVVPPTFEQFITAYERVTTANPELLNDETALAIAVFAEVKRTSAAGGVLMLQGAESLAALWDKATRLTVEEWKLVILNPVKSYKAALTVDLSAQTAMTQMPCEQDINFGNGKADAIRHAYWTALMAKRTTSAFAGLFSDAHESASTGPASAMDLHNNSVGRALVENFPAATETQLLQLILSQRFTLIASGASIPPETVGLVYIAEAARRAFDATFTGSLTNPDSGGAWSMVLNVSQCGSVVRGNLVLDRGTSHAERRLTGTVFNTTSIQMLIDDPYVFENPQGLRFCANMTSTLTGSYTNLAGDWTSSNCEQGGWIVATRQ